MATGVIRAFALLAAICGASPVSAAEIEVKAEAGYAKFGLESLDDNYLAGGALRAYLVGRLSIEPQFLYLRSTRSSGASGYLFNPNIAFDVTQHAGIRVYVAGAAGYYRYRSSRGLAPSAAVGARIFISERWFVSPELRLGVAAEPFWHLSAGVGYALSKRR